MSDTIVYLIQSGPDGPVKIATAPLEQLRRRIAQMQQGNPQLLLLREILAGDKQLERQLHLRYDQLHVADGWYQPEALDDLPAEPARIPFDTDGEQLKLTARRLQDLARTDAADETA